MSDSGEPFLEWRGVIGLEGSSKKRDVALAVHQAIQPDKQSCNRRFKGLFTKPQVVNCTNDVENTGDRILITDF